MYCILVNADIPKTIWREKIYEHKLKIHFARWNWEIRLFHQTCNCDSHFYPTSYFLDLLPFPWTCCVPPLPLPLFLRVLQEPRQLHRTYISNVKYRLLWGLILQSTSVGNSTIYYQTKFCYLPSNCLRSDVILLPTIIFYLAIYAQTYNLIQSAFRTRTGNWTRRDRDPQSATKESRA